MLRIVQMGLGPIGRAVARQILRQPDLELIGGIDPRSDLVGRDLGEVLRSGPLGLAILPSFEAMSRREAPDILLHATGSVLPEVAPQWTEALARGVHVVSTCEELAYPYYRHPALAAELDRQARAGAAVLLGTGINPGFVMDKLVVTLLAACASVTGVRVVRVVDAATRRESFQRKIGAGVAPAEFGRRKESGRIGHVGLVESAHMIADAMGVTGERRIDETLEPVVAKRRVESDCLAVDPGQVAGIEQSASLVAGGRERVRMELAMYLGADRPRDAISVDGSPPLEFEATSGVPGDEGTMALVLHCTRLVQALAPGLRTMLDVPLRPGSTLSRPA